MAIPNKPYVETPIKYYGGKTNLLPELLPLLNSSKHPTFVSLFTGGGAAEFAKNPQPVEIWNDTLSALNNFYEVVKTPYLSKLLLSRLNRSAYSEHWYKHAKFLYKKYRKAYPTKSKQKIEFAWATYWMCNATFAGGILKGFAFSSSRNQAYTHRYKVSIYDVDALANRMTNVTIMGRDALEVYKLFNKPNTLFYADPPYYNSDCGHYGGYSIEDFTNLLAGLENCKGDFILSSYPSDILKEYSDRNKWYTKTITQVLNVRTPNKTHKQECITTNFDPMKATNETIPLF